MKEILAFLLESILPFLGLLKPDLASFTKLGLEILTELVGGKLSILGKIGQDTT